MDRANSGQLNLDPVQASKRLSRMISGDARKSLKQDQDVDIDEAIRKVIRKEIRSALREIKKGQL